ncbi:MAG: porin [Brachymonas sp.]|nr:porin [Brachymonas sp.]
MKKTLLAAALMSAVGASYAQSGSVTLYGIVDTGYEVTNTKQETYTEATKTTTSTKNRKTGLKSGGLAGPRVGFRGEEPLGNGLSATFNLEMGFNSTTGAFASPYKGSTGFTRRSIVGLKGAFGHLNLGLNNTAVDNFAMDIQGNIRESFVTGKAVGTFYTGKFGGLSVEAFAAHNRDSQTNTNGIKVEDNFSEFGYGAGLKYAAGPFSISAAAQQFRGGKVGRHPVTGVETSNSRTRRDEYGVAANYKLGDTRFVTHYVAVKASPYHSGAYSRWEHANFGVEHKMGNATLVAEVGRNRAKALNNTAVLGDYAKPVSGFGGDFRVKGAGTNFVVGANYAFSKRTDVYVRVGRKKAMNASVYNANNGALLGKVKGRMDYAFAGLRHRF